MTHSAPAAEASLQWDSDVLPVRKSLEFSNGFTPSHHNAPRGRRTLRDIPLLRVQRGRRPLRAEGRQSRPSGPKTLSIPQRMKQRDLKNPSCRISSEMRRENAVRFSNLRQEKGCALLLNPKDSSALWRKRGALFCVKTDFLKKFTILRIPGRVSTPGDTGRSPGYPHRIFPYPFG